MGIHRHMPGEPCNDSCTAPAPASNTERARLYFAARSPGNEHAPVGSLFLYTLGCAFLSAPDASDFESTLERLFLDQADKEEVDGDEILTALCGVIEVAAP